jgi:transglutaminase-like putative cysteine protease
VRAGRGWRKAAALAAMLCVMGCASRPASESVALVRDTSGPRAGYRAEFELRWRGRPVGAAREQLVARPGASGYRFERRERWRVARGDSAVEWEVEVIIDTDGELRGERVALFRDRQLRGSARRTRTGWHIEAAGESRRAPAAAEPAELVLLQLARRRQASWSGTVLLAGFEFAVARLAVEPDGARDRRRVTLAAAAGRLQTRVQLRADGTVAIAAGPDLAARRVARAGDATGPAPDLIALGAVPVTGKPRGAVVLELAPGGAPERQHIGRTSGWIDGGAVGTAWPPLSQPDPAPDPALRALADRIVAGGSRPMDRLRALARHTATRVGGDLSRGTVSAAADVAAAKRADCVGHAVLFSALARAAGFDVRLVSGYRVDGRVLERHMWAVARIGDDIVPIDPTTGEAPAPPGRLVALAAHGSAPAEIALATELAFAGLSGARARFVSP